MSEPPQLETAVVSDKSNTTPVTKTAVLPPSTGISSANMKTAGRSHTQRYASPNALFHNHDSRPRACAHLAKLAGDKGAAGEMALLDTYRTAVRWSEGNKRRRSLSVLAGKRKWDAAEGTTYNSRTPLCSLCKDALGRLHACLECFFVGCWKENHIQKHMSETKHQFAVDLLRGLVYCNGCADYIYDIEYESVRNLELTRVDEMISGAKDPLNKRSRFMIYTLDEHEAQLIRKSSTLSTCTGLRGLRNIGNTCYMNAILQSMIHNPLLRSFYLADRHNSILCDWNEANKRPCMACETDKLFSEVYSGESKPFGPCGFLWSIWQCADELAGYKQHDAHEFFIAVLNQLHANHSDNANHSHTCRCIVHRTFAGTFQSDVTCLSCGNVTTAHDPFLDISLDIRNTIKKRKGNPNHVNAAPTSSDLAPNSLLDCLDRYTCSEKLGLKDYACIKCDSAQEATKQLSIKRLPPVISFQLKRFEHFSGTSKIETQISFSDELDLAPYTTSQRAHKSPPVSSSSSPSSTTPSFSSSTCSPAVSGSSTGSSQTTITNASSSESDASRLNGISASKPKRRDHIYDLFAVINHSGKADTGHYTAFSRYRGQWFRFDDHTVRLSTRPDVLASQAYMLYYVKRNLEYSQLTPVTSIPPRAPPRMKTNEAGLEPVKEEQKY